MNTSRTLRGLMVQLVRNDAVSSDSDEEKDKDESSSKKNEVSYDTLFFGRILSDISTQRKMQFQNTKIHRNLFIDDSELAIDERQFFAQTNQQEIYVSSGEVALLEDKYVQIGVLLSRSQPTYFTYRIFKTMIILFVACLQKSLHTEKKQRVFEGTKETPIIMIDGYRRHR